jgi:iodothyronine deiodinase-like protein
MYRNLQARTSFAFVYIAEAHTTDGWQLQSNLEDDVLVAAHATLDDRFAAAREGVARLGLTMPVLVDGMDDAVSEAFAAWPERIFVVGADARIVFAGGPGPFEFDPDAAGTALAAVL